MSVHSPSQPSSLLTRQRARQLETVHRAVTIGLSSAATQLSAFVGKQIVIEAPRLGLCAIEDLVDYALGTAFDEGHSSDAEAIRTGIYLSIEGDVEGHFLLLLEPSNAHALVDPLLRDLAIDPELYEGLVVSALGEVGNITACSLLNALADATHLRIGPSCPVVVTDMAGAILEMPMLDIAQFASEALFIETHIVMDSVATTGALALIPRPDGLDALIRGLTQTKGRGGR